MKVEEPIEEFEFKNMDYDRGDRSKEQNSTNNPRSPSIQEHLTTNEQMKSERQRQNNDTENRNLNVYTRSGRLVKRPERLNL